MDEKSIWNKTTEELTMKDQLVITGVLTAVAVAPLVISGVVSIIKVKLHRRAQKQQDFRDGIIDIEI